MPENSMYVCMFVCDKTHHGVHSYAVLVTFFGSFLHGFCNHQLMSSWDTPSGVELETTFDF